MFCLSFGLNDIQAGDLSLSLIFGRIAKQRDLKADSEQIQAHCYCRGQIASTQLFNSHAYLSIFHFEAFPPACTNVLKNHANMIPAGTHPVIISI